MTTSLRSLCLHTLTVATLLATHATAVLASNDGHAGLGLLTLLCVVQSDPQHETPIGKETAADPGYQQFRKGMDESSVHRQGVFHIPEER